MKFGFQINLDVKDRPCVVVGGGDEATEKSNRLLDAGARVTVVSPTLSDELKVLAASARVLHRGRRFKASDVEGGIWLVLNTVRTDEVLSRDLYALAKQKGSDLWLCAGIFVAALLYYFLFVRPRPGRYWTVSGAVPDSDPAVTGGPTER